MLTKALNHNLIKDKIHIAPISYYGNWNAFCEWRNQYHYPDIAWNFRDLGDYPTKDGKEIKTNSIYRSSRLVITPSKAKTLNQLGIDTIIDLRNYANWIKNKDTGETNGHVGDIKYIHAPIYSQKEYDKYGFDSCIYGNQVINNPNSNRALHKVFTTLLRSHGKTLINCDWGCDRTGITSMMIEAVLGVPFDYLVSDYVLTHHYAYKYRNNTKAIYPWLKKYIKLIIASRIINLIITIDNTYGSIINYVEDKGIISKNGVKVLQNKFKK